MKQHLTVTLIAPGLSANRPVLPLSETSVAFSLGGKRMLTRILARQAARVCFARALQDLPDLQKTSPDESLAKPGAGV